MSRQSFPPRSIAAAAGAERTIADTVAGTCASRGARRPRGARRLALLRAAAPALAAFLALSATSAAAQIAEPVRHMEPPRAPGVDLPPGAPDAFARLGPLGIFEAPRQPVPPPARQAGRPNPPNVVVLLGLFEDSPESPFSAADVRRVLFDGPSEQGTFVEFYREASRGMVEPGGTVAPWVRTDVTLFEAAGDLNGHGWVGERMAEYVVRTVAAADDEIDFGAFDNDGPDGVPNSGDDDGFVDALVIEYLEVAGSCGGPGPWPHFSAVRESPEVPGWPTDDLRPNGAPVRVYTYLTESVADCAGTGIQGPNVIAHEYGHLLGLPDVYQAVEGIEPEKRHWNIGCFGVMGAGSWGCGTGGKANSFGPVHHSVLMKETLGWMPIQRPGEVREQEFVLEPAQTTGAGLAFPVEDGQVYIEYRPRIGFDTWLPAGGVLLYHYDPQAAERTVPPGLPPAKRYHLIEADGDHALRKVEAQGGNRGVAEDVFGLDGRTGPYSGAPGGPVRLLTHEGRPMTLTVHSVRVFGDVARVVVSSAAEPAAVAVVQGPPLGFQEEGLLASFRIAGGAPPYEAELAGDGVNATLSLDGFEALLEGRAPLGVGLVDVLLRVTDALGTTVNVAVPVLGVYPDFGLDVLVDRVLDAPGPDDDAAAFLDLQGNGNGMPDLGDLRAYMLATGGFGG